MRKRVLAILMVAVMVFALSACGGNGSGGSAAVPPPADSGSEDAGSSAATPAAEVTELVYVHGNSDGSIQDELFKYFAEQVEKESNGSLKLTIHGSGTLVTADQFYEAVTTARVDMAEGPTPYYAPYIEELNILTVPGILKNGDFAKICAAMRDPVDALMQKHGLKVICSTVTGSNWFVGDKVLKDPAADLSGGTLVRVTGESNGAAVTSWGASPVNIPIGDLPTALERKTVNQALTVMTMVDGMKLYEQAPHVTISNMLEPYCTVVMNLDKWNSLTTEQQDALMRADAAYEKKSQETWLARAEEIKTMFDEQGVEYYEYTDADFDFFYEHAIEVMNANYAYSSDDAKNILAAIESVK